MRIRQCFLIPIAKTVLSYIYLTSLLELYWPRIFSKNGKLNGLQNLTAAIRKEGFLEQSIQNGHKREFDFTHLDMLFMVLAV